MRKELLRQLSKLLLQISSLRKQLILKKCRDYQNIDFTPQDEIPDEVSCAFSLTTILVQCGAMDRIIPGTYTLLRYFLNSRMWVPVQALEPGDVVVFATGTGNGSMRGHCFIVDVDGWWSNDSYDGRWKKNYTKGTAMNRYVKQGGFKPYAFRYMSVL